MLIRKLFNRAKPLSAKKLAIDLAIFLVLLFVLFWLGYKVMERAARWYIVGAAQKLIALEKGNRLSKQYGYVWSEIQQHRKMQRVREGIVHTDSSQDSVYVDLQDSRRIKEDIPSLAAIRELNQIRRYSNLILITDRNDRFLAEIKTTHQRIKTGELNQVLLKSLIVSEDRNYFERELAYEYKAFVRAAVVAFFRSIRRLQLSYPRGTSTIHQQVARFLLSKFDSRGFVFIERSLGRKIKELKLAQALKMHYTNEEILEVYLNHCISAGDGMVGLHDISMGLFGKPPKNLDTCQSLYLARLVKWNRHVPPKVIQQVELDMGRIAPYLGWNREQQDSIIQAMSHLAFQKPIRIVSEQSPIIDLANEYWLMACKRNGMSKHDLAEMDFAKPNTLIRRKGNLKIQLQVDVRLQKLLEEQISRRRFGGDTSFVTDVRIGSYGEDMPLDSIPPDTLRVVTVLETDSAFSEPGSEFLVHLRADDTLVTNIRYHRKHDGTIRRSVFFYRRDTIHVPGQYYSYAMMNSKTGELLAYYSLDRVGSRLGSLLRNRIPNGSAVAKPILFALNFDLENFKPMDMTTDSLELIDDVPWQRRFLEEDGQRIGVVYLNSAEPEGYPVHNHHKGFDGYDYVFNHLARSNNIIGVEAIYRLNTPIYDRRGKMPRQAKEIREVLNRLGAWDEYNEAEAQRVTGAQVYREIAKVVGAPVDSTVIKGRRMLLPDDLYSLALGTLELSLYEQMHIFNVLYNNEIIEKPAEHPSLVIKRISIAGQDIPVRDRIERRSLFADMRNILPAKLGMFKRLTSNPFDNLYSFDMPIDSAAAAHGRFEAAEPLTNFAKSGTSDDIIRPYYADVTSDERTNYGLWNACLRVKLTRHDFSKTMDSTAAASRAALDPVYASLLETGDVPDEEILDITLACLGECNRERTGRRDGKSLHKYVSSALLHRHGIPVDVGFYRAYEKYLVVNTPDRIRFRNPYQRADIDVATLKRIQRKVRSRHIQEVDTLYFERRFFLFGGYRLERKSYLKLLSFAPYLGAGSKQYLVAVEQLKKFKEVEDARKALEQMQGIEVDSQFLRDEFDEALEDLEASLDGLERQ